MKSDRPTLHFFPVAFSVLLLGELVVLTEGPGKLGLIPVFWITISVIIVASAILIFWLLALAPGQSAYKPWKAILRHLIDLMKSLRKKKPPKGAARIA